MAGKNKKKGLPFWSVDTDGNKPTSFIQVDNTLLTSERCKNLTATQFRIYIAMIGVCRGRQEFLFTASIAEEYGIKPRTLWRNIDDLIKAGFVKKKRSGKNTRDPNVYEFCPDWREHNC